jgi:hypothetical protein
MATIPKKLFSATLGDTVSTLATVPGSQTWIITDLWIVNTTGAAVYVTILHGTDELLSAIEVEKTQIVGSIILTETEVLKGLASVASGVNVIAYGRVV